MPALLVSVRNSREAATAMAGGATVIDVKDPGRGSLGRAHPQLWAQVVARVDGRVPVSVALGELVDFRLQQAAEGWRGIAFAKLGLSRCQDETTWPTRWQEALDALPSGVRSVAVVYADAATSGSPPPDEILRYARDLGCWGVLFDTYHKQGRTLLDWLSPPQLAAYIETTRRHGMAVVLAGSIDSRNVEEAMELRPDLIAVRRAACRGGRNGRVDLEKVQRLAQIVSGVPRIPRECPLSLPWHD